MTVFRSLNKFLFSVLLINISHVVYYVKYIVKTNVHMLARAFFMK